ncbi:MAG: hypothetical protein KA712_18565 [Myxococcales bacterium]|nr:hypothetical protein [Myxococcales bacterium]
MARKRNAPLLTGLWVLGFLGAGACGGDDEPTTAKTFAATYVNDWATYCTRVGLCSAEAGQVCAESILEPAAVEAAVDEVSWTSRDMDTCAQALRTADDCRLAGSCDQLLGTPQSGTASLCGVGEDLDFCCFGPDGEEIDCTPALVPCREELIAAAKACQKIESVLFAGDE